MVEKDRRADEKVISLKAWKLRKKHKRLFDFLSKIRRFFRKNNSNNKEDGNGFSRTVNH